jgi:hypothetical protein
MMASHGTRRKAVGPALPRQRTAEQVVLALLVADEPCEGVVRLAARAAEDQDLPLHLALLADGETTVAHSMVEMDHALTVARAASPDLQVTVSGPFGAEHAGDLEELGAARTRLVVCSRGARARIDADPDLAWLARTRLTVV